MVDDYRHDKIGQMSKMCIYSPIVPPIFHKWTCPDQTHGSVEWTCVLNQIQSKQACYLLFRYTSSNDLTDLLKISPKKWKYVEPEIEFIVIYTKETFGITKVSVVLRDY